MFSFAKKNDLFNDAENEQIVQAIREAEKRTSGEIRVYVETKNPLVNPLERAAIIFYKLKMEETENRNAVLIYIASKHHELAVFGDQGIHEQVGTTYWENEVKQMLTYFKNQKLTEGLIQCIRHIGETLTEKFPYHHEDKNELPDAIVFGR